jgi:Zn-dependent metalloprotease
MPVRRSLPLGWIAALALLLALGVSLTLSISQASPLSGPRRAFRDLQSQAAAPLAVRWEPRTNTPAFLRGALPYVLDAAEKAAPATGAIHFLNRYRALFRMTDPASELTLMKADKDALGQTHVRLSQVYQGVPVFDHSLYVHIDREGRVMGVNGGYEPGLALAVKPGVTAETAEGLALQATGSASAKPIGAPQLGVYVDDQGHATLTWKLTVETSRPFARDFYFVNARGGAVVKVLPAVAYEKNRSVYDAHGTESADRVSQEGEVPDDPAGAEVYQAAGKTYDYYANTFSRDSFDDAGGEISLIVHGPENDNAYWSGDSLWFGDGDGEVFDKPLTSLDTVAHEFTHAVTQYTANLAYENQSGALNESFSDVFGVMVDRSNWHLGETIVNCATMPKKHCWLRDMEDPTLGGDFPKGDWGQPAVMADYVKLANDRKHDYGGVHVNSGIPNHTFYLAVQASSKEAMEQVWYRALTVYLTESSDFADFADALKSSAADLYGDGSAEGQAVEKAIKGVGLTGGGGSAKVPTPEPSPTAKPRAMPTPTPVAVSGCTELVTNGGFEAKKVAPWVEQTSADVELVTNDFPHTGQQSAWLGGTDQESYQYLFQQIKLPATAKGLTLTYWRYLHEETVKSKAKAATFTVLLTDTNDDVLETLEEFSSTDGDDEWRQSTLDLSKYAGKSVRLAFASDMVRNNVSSFFVDDVTLQGCAKGGSGGSPSNAKGVELQGKIVDASTGKAIEGAAVYILAPGKTVKQVMADGKVSKGEYIAAAVTDKKGQYIVPDLLARGQNYSAVVIAKGYRSAGSDNILKFDDKTASPQTLNAKLDKGF